MRLVATDLDGTLLRPDGSISDYTRRVLGRARAAGIAVVLVTARPPRTLRALVRDLDLPAGPAICCNGAMVYDPGRDEIVRHYPMRPELAASVIRKLRMAAPGVRFALELGARWGFEPGYAGMRPEVRGRPGGLEADALELAAAAPVTKLIARHPDLPASELLALAREAAGDAAHMTHSSASFIEISAAGVHKARALAALCSRLGVPPPEVAAFGDMPNDLPMLGWAGVGVAVANAHPEVLAAADEVTLSNDEDGVAAALDRLLHHRAGAPEAPGGR